MAKTKQAKGTKHGKADYKAMAQLLEDNAKAGSKMGRPTEYSPEKAAAICADVCEMKLLDALKLNGVSKTSFFRWQQEYPDFRELYARAREARGEMMFEETVDIPDSLPTGLSWKMPDGRFVEPKDFQKLPDHEKEGAELVGLTSEMVSLAKLRMQARQWYLAKLLPDRFGERIDHTHKGDKALPLTFTLKIDNS